jgi:hypothetical protein
MLGCDLVVPPSLLDMYDWDVIWWYTYACGPNFFVYVYICMWFELNFKP